VGENEAQGRVFGPIAVVPDATSDAARKAQWPPCSVARNVMCGFAAMVLRVARRDSDERIVLCMQDERGHRMRSSTRAAPRARIIIIRRAEPTVERSDALIELAQGSDISTRCGSNARGKNEALRRKRLTSPRTNLRS
jgi:hypothetical protein